MEPVIFLDMDGVCSDFPRAVIGKHGQDPDKVLAEWKREHQGKSHSYEVMGLKDTSFWNATNHREESFWTDLEEGSLWIPGR